MLEGREPLGLHPVGTSLIENLHLVEGRLEVVRGRSLDLQGNIRVVV
jgi:hypothetical protein